ncbi:MAG: hypothetical protein ACR2PZ_07875 [Pseudomonadales bacterium]
MKREPKSIFLRYLCGILLFVAAPFVIAADGPPPEPGVAEAFFCNYKPGKDRGDLMSAKDYYVKQAAKAGITPDTSFLWTLFKGSAPVDFLWMSVHENMKAFGASTDASMASSEMDSVGARFDSVAKCQSNIGALRTIREAELNVEKPPALISAASCNTHGPITQGDVMDMRNHINSVLGAIPSFKNVPMYSIVPLTTNPESPDVFLFSVHDSVAGWATRTGELQASAEGKSLRRHFDAMMECHPSLWFGEQLIAPPEG